jgi:hypothetical protein
MKIVKLLSKHYRLYLRDGKELKNTSELRDARAFVEIVALRQSCGAPSFPGDDFGVNGRCSKKGVAEV